jgi:hypothetical protein
VTLRTIQRPGASKSEEEYSGYGDSDDWDDEEAARRRVGVRVECREFNSPTLVEKSPRSPGRAKCKSACAGPGNQELSSPVESREEGPDESLEWHVR